MKSCAWLLLFVLIASPAVEAADSFETALAEAKENLKTTLGAKYDEQFGASFGSRVPDIMMACTESVSGDDLATFNLVAKVAADGTIEEVMAEPGTKLRFVFAIACLDRGIRSRQLRTTGYSSTSRSSSECAPNSAAAPDEARVTILVT